MPTDGQGGGGGGGGGVEHLNRAFVLEDAEILEQLAPAIDRLGANPRTGGPHVACGDRRHQPLQAGDKGARRQ